MFLIMFNTGHALLLPGGRVSRPRNCREAVAHQPRYVMYSWPQTRHWLEREQVQCRTRTQIVRVRKQSASASCPRKQLHSQTLRVHGQATASIVHERAATAGVNCPQTIRSREQSTFTNWLPTQFVRKREPSNNYPHRCIAVSACASANFPVHIQTIPFYDRV